MTDINTNYQYQSKYQGLSKGKIAMLSKDEKMQILVPKGSDLLMQRVEREVPENGKFKKISVSFDIPDTQNKAQFFIEADAKDYKDKRILSIGVHHQNSDRVVSNYMFKGTKQEIIDYLKDSKNFPEFTQTVNELSTAVDDYYASL